MPWGAIQLRPGVDTQLTLSANSAGVSASQMVRYKEGLIQTYGGWQSYVGFTLPSTVRDLLPWQDAAGVQHLAVAGTAQLAVITASQVFDITPQTVTTNPTPSFSIVTASNIVTIVDANANASVLNTVYLNTPVSVGGFVLSGAYPIVSIISSATGTYTIRSSVNASVTASSSGQLPKFTTVSGTAGVTVTLPSHGFSVIPGLFQQFIAPTTVAGQTIQGKYQVVSVLDTTSFTINLTVQASAAATATMNASLAQLLYYVTIGPLPSGTGFGALGFGGGGFGSGSSVAPLSVAGTPITATDWTQANWGEILLSCPFNGPIYQWAPDFGNQTAQVVNQAPFFNGGIFISMPQQILVSWRSVQSTGVQDNLIVRWSNALDYTNWAVTNQTTAGSFHIPTGSVIVGGLQCPQFGLISTDVDVWTMTYVGGTVIFNFTKVGGGCGWISSHACGILSGNPFWMGTNNFFTLGPNGVMPMPCTVWDAVFQNLKTTVQTKTRVAVNSSFNEVMWLYPSAASTGECDSYVKAHIEGQEYEWDYGTIDRTAWVDASILGMPLGVDHNGQIYQHETGTAITGAGLPSFQTGWWTIAEGQDIGFIDLIIPDFIFGLRSASPNATITITFYGVNHPDDTPTQYGPFVVSSSTSFINCRIRNRLLSAVISSNASSEFWRLGRIRFRFGQSGRR